MRAAKILLRLATLGWLAFIVFATLSRLSSRPTLVNTGTELITAFERFCAYAVLGFLCRLSFPNRPRLVVISILGIIVGLEFAQFVVPDRDPRLIDTLEKALGGWVGFFVSFLAEKVFRRVLRLG
jgi:VanZ family protein